MFALRLRPVPNAPSESEVRIDAVPYLEENKNNAIGLS